MPLIFRIGDTSVPYFVAYLNMINAAQIRDLVESEIERLGLFLVEITVHPGNKIAVFVDSMKGVTLEECKTVSRYLEGRLDRNAEDFELEVSSPGLDKPLKLPVQYEKNTGRGLEIVKKDGIKVSGKLLATGQGFITIEKEVVQKSGKGKKKIELTAEDIKLEEIKTAKVVISLKK